MALDLVFSVKMLNQLIVLLVFFSHNTTEVKLNKLVNIWKTVQREKEALKNAPAELLEGRSVAVLYAGIPFSLEMCVCLAS